ncbi:MAG: hypothetical protein J6Y92_09955 [Lentisphaeria bacterium]|nr:hypothetical protein [Lentisphaeria bacterium]
MSKGTEQTNVYWVRLELKGARTSTSQRARHILEDIRRTTGADAQMISSCEMAKLIAGAIRSVCTEQDQNGQTVEGAEA